MNKTIVLGLCSVLGVCLMASECSDFAIEEDLVGFIEDQVDCDDNESQRCQCQDGSSGFQLCLPDAGAWEACICGTPCTPSPERCDGEDNDCDGQVDEGASDALIWYADRDGDGYGDENSIWYACDAPAGYVANSSDCDDDPTACGANCYPRDDPDADNCDGYNNDCDSAVDEDC